MRHERFDTPGKLRLDLSVPAGEVDIRAEEGTAETTVKVFPSRFILNLSSTLPAVWI